MLARPQEGPHSGLERCVATATIHFTADKPKLVKARMAKKERGTVTHPMKVW